MGGATRISGKLISETRRNSCSHKELHPPTVLFILSLFGLRMFMHFFIRFLQGFPGCSDFVL